MTVGKTLLFRATICAVMFFPSLLSASGEDAILRHSFAEPGISELTAGINEVPGDYSQAVAENIICRWKAIPNSLVQNPDMKWQSIVFQANGNVEISYEMNSDGIDQQFVGSYEVVHKAKLGRGNPPNIVIRSRHAEIENLNVLVKVRIGEFSYFPPGNPVLWFQDPDGYDYVFEPAEISDERRMKLLYRASTKEEDDSHRNTKNNHFQ